MSENKGVETVDRRAEAPVTAIIIFLAGVVGTVVAASIVSSWLGIGCVSMWLILFAVAMSQPLPREGSDINVR